MRINLNPYNQTGSNPTMWESVETDPLPYGVEKIILDTKGDLTLRSANGKTWFSQSHLVDDHPVAVEQQLVSSKQKNHVDGWTGMVIGNAGENRVRDILVKTGKVNPEDILMPYLVLTDDGHKELSDGIVIYGNHAFVLQVKTSLPTHPLDDVDWYRQKMRSSRNHAVRQAMDSMELLKQEKRIEFTTYAGTKRTINFNDYSWSQIAILAFNELPLAKPARYYIGSSSRLPLTTISLKEWKDLFTILNPYDALAYLKRRTYCDEPDFFGFNIFSLFQTVDLGIYSTNKDGVPDNFVQAVEKLFNKEKPSKKLFELRKKLDCLPVEKLAVLSDAYKKHQGINTKTLIVHRHLKVVFTSGSPRIEYKTQNVVIYL